MTSSFTPNKGYEQPARNDYPNTWDVPVNANYDVIDSNLGGVLTLALSSTNVDLTDEQAQNAIYVLEGTLLADVTVTFPAVGSFYIVRNDTTGSFTVTLACAGMGTDYAIPQGFQVFIYTDGTDLSRADDVISDSGKWFYDPESTKTNDYTILGTDVGTTVIANKGTAITFNLTAAATIGAGFICLIKNIGAGDLTIDPNGSETINGATTETLSQNAAVILVCTGSAWRSYGIAPLATAAQWRANTPGAALTTDQVWDAMAEVTLSDGATIAWDMSTGYDFTVTLAGNRALANATNVKVGQRGRLRVVQDATGGRTLTYGTNYEFSNGTTPTLTSTANAEDVLYYDCISATRILITIVRNIS